MNYEEIKIGALYPLSGELSEVGQSIRNALEFYVALVNNSCNLRALGTLKLPNFKGRQIKLVWGDTKGDQMVAISEAKRLINEEKVISLIGCYQSSVTSAVTLVTEGYGIPFICPDADAGVIINRGLKWLFKTGPSDYIYTRAFFNMMNEYGLSGSSVSALAENTLLGQGDASSVIALGRVYNYKLKSVELFNPLLWNPVEVATDISKANPDFLFMGMFGKDGVKFIEALDSIRYYPMGLYDQTGEFSLKTTREALGENANYILSSVPWSLGVGRVKPISEEVNKMYKATYGEDLNTVNSASFTGIYTLIDAIYRSNCLSNEEIRQSLKSTNICSDDIIMPWKGVAFDKRGMNVYAESILVQIFNERLYIVWPRFWAERKIVLPACYYTGGKRK